MSDYTNNELKLLMQNLDKKVTDGFAGVHKRQDIANGKVLTNSEWRLKSEGSISTIKWVVSLIGITTIVNVIVNVIK